MKEKNPGKNKTVIDVAICVWSDIFKYVQILHGEILSWVMVQWWRRKPGWKIKTLKKL